MVTSAKGAAGLEMGGVVLAAPPDPGGAIPGELLAGVGSCIGLEGSQDRGEGGPLNEEAVDAVANGRAEDGAEEVRKGELKAVKEDSGNFEVREVGGNSKETDAGGGAGEGMVDSDMGGISARDNGWKGGDEGGEKGGVNFLETFSEGETEGGSRPT